MTAQPNVSLRQFSLAEILVLVTLAALLVGSWAATGLLSVLLWVPAASLLHLCGKRSLLSVTGAVLAMGMMVGGFLVICILPFVLLFYVISGDLIWLHSIPLAGLAGVVYSAVYTLNSLRDSTIEEA